MDNTDKYTSGPLITDFMFIFSGYVRTTKLSKQLVTFSAHMKRRFIASPILSHAIINKEVPYYCRTLIIRKHASKFREFHE